MTCIDQQRVNFIKNVDAFREKFKIRIEVGCRLLSNIQEHTDYRNMLKSYLQSVLAQDKYALQDDMGYHGRHYVWFADKEDALAIMLKFNGKIV